MQYIFRKSLCPKTRTMRTYTGTDCNHTSCVIIFAWIVSSYWNVYFFLNKLNEFKSKKKLVIFFLFRLNDLVYFHFTLESRLYFAIENKQEIIFHLLVRNKYSEWIKIIFLLVFRRNNNALKKDCWGTI